MGKSAILNAIVTHIGKSDMHFMTKAMTKRQGNDVSKMLITNFDLEDGVIEIKVITKVMGCGVFDIFIKNPRQIRIIIS